MEGAAHGAAADQRRHGGRTHATPAGRAPAVDARQRGRDARERPAGAEPGGAGGMRREVAVPAPEPGREAEPAQGRQAGEAVAREAPPATPRRDPGERVDDGVEVRRDVEPEELLVVAGVADDREPPRVSAPDEAREEPGPAHATRQHRDPHGWRSRPRPSP